MLDLPVIGQLAPQAARAEHEQGRRPQGFEST
jgi:hypothetical protein